MIAKRFLVIAGSIRCYTEQSTGLNNYIIETKFIETTEKYMNMGFFFFKFIDWQGLRITKI